VVDTSKYNNNFYKTDWRKESAVNILSALLELLPKINSAVDFGCGLGTWLAVLKNLGVNEIKGYDGHWVDRESLEISRECFTSIDLDKKITVENRYDLAISMEVAEHLPEKSAKNFIGALTTASDIVLFSAGIPYQGGANHINEQWQDYWYGLFQEFDYVGTDIIRRLVWNDKRIGFWYRQNVMLYVKKDKLDEIKIPSGGSEYLNVVHPEMYMKKMANENIYNMPLFTLYKKIIKRTIKKIVGEKAVEHIKKNWDRKTSHNDQ